MAANSTTLLAAIASALASEFTVPVAVRRGTDQSPLYTPPEKLPRFAVQLLDGEKIEEAGSWPDAATGKNVRKVFVTYPVVVAYLSPVLPNAPDDSATRTVREQVRQLLHRPQMAGLGIVNDVTATGGSVYTAAHKNAIVNVSVWNFQVECLEVAQS